MPRIAPGGTLLQTAVRADELMLPILPAICNTIPRTATRGIDPIDPDSVQGHYQLAVSKVMAAFQSSAKRPTAVCNRLFTVPTGIPRIPAISA